MITKIAASCPLCQALQQMEKNLKGLELKVEMLRGGVRARDNALRLMRDEVDRSFEVLSNAAENREVRYSFWYYYYYCYYYCYKTFQDLTFISIFLKINIQ